MKTYFVTGAVDVVWGGAVQFGSNNPYFQAAVDKLDNPEFISLGNLEKRLVGADLSDNQVYIDEKFPALKETLKSDFPALRVEIFEAAEKVPNVPILTSNPMIKFLEAIIVLLFFLLALFAFLSLTHNVLWGFFGAIIIAALMILVFASYPKLLKRQLKKYQE
ncbi:hypothetical protein [Lactovum odontotermitis]